MSDQSKMQSPSSKASIDAQVEQIAARQLCETDHLFFSRYFFKHRQGIKFRVNWHHILISDAVERVISGECKNLLINVPPGSSKTELVAINFMARGLALNPRARFLHISYSDELALLNSQTAKDLVNSDEFQAFWPLKVADDAKAKKRWNVMVDDKAAGGVYAVSLGGQITGFRGGRMTEGFQGAIIIDDPLKPDDGFSKTKRDAANRSLISTVKSRKANPDTPIVVIMQRLTEMDCTGFIQGGNLPGEWEEVIIPALITDEYVEKLPDNIREKVDSSERDKDGRFSYWPYKEPLSDLLAMEKGSGNDQNGAKVSRYVFSAQYMQRPSPLGGDIIKGAFFGRYKVLPKLLYRKIFADTAQKTKESNDYSVFECWGYGVDGRAYLIDLIRGKWEAPELEARAVDFWNKHKALNSKMLGTLRAMHVEDKVSGTGLIQGIRKKALMPVVAVQRNTDKYMRVMDITPHIESGYVYLPESAPFVNDFIAECEAFTADDTHQFDDQIDPMCDAINDMLATVNPISIWSKQ